MNVHCPSCNTVFRVDPAKVPESGIKARCTICSQVLTVTPLGEVTTTAPATAAGGVAGTPTASSAPTTMTEEMAFVTDINGVCRAGVTLQTT